MGQLPESVPVRNWPVVGKLNQKAHPVIYNMDENVAFPAEIPIPVKTVPTTSHQLAVRNCVQSAGAKLGQLIWAPTQTPVQMPEFQSNSSAAASQSLFSVLASTLSSQIECSTTGSLGVHTEIQCLHPLQEYSTEPLFSHCLSIEQKIAVILGYLQDAHIAPVNIMLHVLDPHLLEHDRYWVGLYKEKREWEAVKFDGCYQRDSHIEHPSSVHH